MDPSTRLEQRRLKFSKDASKKILDDPLSDKSLISRGSDLSILQKDQTAREQLLSRIKKSQDKHTVDHGLRKLREAIVSVFNDSRDDPTLIAFVYEVYQLSYDYFFREQDFTKLGNLVLNFMFQKFPADSHFQQLYALYSSHVESNLSKCISILANNRRPSITVQERQLIRLSSIYLINLESPSQWFFILSHLPRRQIQFLTSIAAFQHMKERCYKYIKTCYNQVTLDYVLDSWFYNMVGNSDIPNDWPLESIGGVQTLVLKRGTKT
ncbi:hypothetical protein ZYGR_0AD01660 [Zygosaccharomyces rouxii]|uniref:ZYRO0G09790p n=2 Tax=Zygosaccharomyces rouxii TaxID=4956 RepID=C5E050_ZYGRC|nr:uncharacterized protein ZYRO0G09790g [Zygosaccharomyces rouxii]KAH9202479.1 hypothetical protein LQ764DRAFT_207455 [Zygosaccharomyces rouxii]GAV50983.1 hypothetical protein ZYGR_0AD01660 [Zygosaccharomyces rouxii]CAR29484.1 ZYRO0G09790p [Zygosaccharomyces rouxii]